MTTHRASSPSVPEVPCRVTLYAEWNKEKCTSDAAVEATAWCLTEIGYNQHGEAKCVLMFRANTKQEIFAITVRGSLPRLYGSSALLDRKTIQPANLFALTRRFLRDPPKVLTEDGPLRRLCLSGVSLGIGAKGVTGFEGMCAMAREASFMTFANTAAMVATYQHPLHWIGSIDIVRRAQKHAHADLPMAKCGSWLSAVAGILCIYGAMCDRALNNLVLEYADPKPLWDVLVDHEQGTLNPTRTRLWNGVPNPIMWISGRAQDPLSTGQSLRITPRWTTGVGGGRHVLRVRCVEASLGLCDDFVEPRLWDGSGSFASDCIDVTHKGDSIEIIRRLDGMISDSRVVVCDKPTVLSVYFASGPDCYLDIDPLE